jgi:hypothetical protein
MQHEGDIEERVVIMFKSVEQNPEIAVDQEIVE